MADQIETQPGTALQVSEGGQVTPAAMFQALMRAASDPRVDPTKMTALVDLQIKVMDYQKQEQFNQDKATAINEMPIIDKKGRVVIPANREKGTSERLQSRYSKWEDIHAAIMPILAQHNLVINHNIGHQGNMVTVTPILTHTNGFVEKGEPMALPIDNSGSKNATQGVGSAASYGQRYSTIAMLNIRQQNADDDGAATGKPAPARELNEQEELLVSDGRAAAKKGGEAYEGWFRGLESPQRGWLVVSGKHDLFKRDAGLK